ncbi:MAG: LemA family protein [Christensenellaceae bacterium]
MDQYGQRLIRLKNKVEEAWATIDVFLKKRYDLIPNLVETVKGYSKHGETSKTSLRREVRRCPPKRPKPNGGRKGIFGFYPHLYFRCE